MLENLSGLMIGGMNGMNDNNIPFGKTAEEIIHDVVSEYTYPVAFNIPAGHINDNLPLLSGKSKLFCYNKSSFNQIVNHKTTLTPKVKKPRYILVFLLLKRTKYVTITYLRRT